MTTIYKHVAGDWMPIKNPTTDVNRFMGFESSRRDSFIWEFDLLGYTDGSVSLCVKFQKTPDASQYFEKHGITLEHLHEVFQSYTPHDPQDLKSVFKIITENGEIPSPHFETIKKIIELRPCRTSYF